MANKTLDSCSSYADACFILTTKHAKSIAIAPAFKNQLEANVIEYLIDTDQFGTFSGEIERKGTAIECAKQKCEWSIKNLGHNVEFALASEGSFGPHPFIPFLPCNHEILYLIDRRHNFHLHVSHISEKTNYRSESIDSFELLEKFAQDIGFPSHALIISPDCKTNNNLIFKGINSHDQLYEAFKEAMKYSKTGKIFVTTDMRAHYNPTRMQVIHEAAKKLAARLASHCPSCNIPGFGKIRDEKGLECSLCGLETMLAKSEIFSCVKCDYQEKREILNGYQFANPENCLNCNP